MIGEREDSLAVGTRHGEEMLQDIGDSLAQLGCEVAEDQMGIRLAHRSHVLDVVAHHRVGDAEISGGTVR